MWAAKMNIDVAGTPSLLLERSHPIRVTGLVSVIPVHQVKIGLITTQQDYASSRPVIMKMAMAILE